MPPWRLLCLLRKERRARMRKIFENALVVTFMMVLGAFFIFSSVEYSSAQKEDVYYVCPMWQHASVHAGAGTDKPGKCPLCGKNLVEKKIYIAKYVCPMHPDVVSDGFANCPTCWSPMVPVETEK